MKNLVGIGIDGKADGLAGMDIANIGLVDRRPYLHALEVFGNQKEARRIEAGHHGLPDVNPPIDDNAFDRRADRAIAEIALSAFQDRLCLGYGCLSLADGGYGYRYIGLGCLIRRFVGIIAGGCQRLGRSQFLGPLPVALGLVELGLRLYQVGIGPGHTCLGHLQLGACLCGIGGIQRVIDSGQHHPFVHCGAIVDGFTVFVFPEGNDLPGNLSSDINHFLRFHCTGGRNGNHKIVAFDLGRAIRDGLVLGASEIPCSARSRQAQHQHDDNAPFNQSFHSTGSQSSALSSSPHSIRRRTSRMPARLNKVTCSAMASMPAFNGDGSPA